MNSAGVAVFWDFDNIRGSTDQICLYADAILSYSKSFGIIKYLGCCAVWSSVSPNIQEALVAHGFILVQNPTSEPNAADNALADQLLSIFKQGTTISDFVLITNDHGFLYHMGVVHAQGARVHLITSQSVKKQEFLGRAAQHWKVDDLVKKHEHDFDTKCYASEEWKNRQNIRRTEVFKLWQTAIADQLPKIEAEVRRMIIGRLKNPPPRPPELTDDKLAILGLERWTQVHQSGLLQANTAEYLSSELGLPIEMVEDILDELLHPNIYYYSNKITPKTIKCEYCNRMFRKQIDLNQHFAIVHGNAIKSKNEKMAS